VADTKERVVRSVADTARICDIEKNILKFVDF
jgi:hypothetical protein